MGSPKNDGGVARWGAELIGHEFDLQDWEDELKPPFDPWIERIEKAHVLRSARFDGLQAPTEARAQAEVLVEQLNGAMAAVEDSLPVHLNGTIVQFAFDGTRRHHRGLVAETVKFRGRFGSAVFTGANAPAAEPRPSSAQDWVRIAETNDRLSDALVHLGKGGWFELYKAIECVEASAGGRKQLIAGGWIEPAKLKSVMDTANSLYRHHRGRMTPPPLPATIEAARSVVIELLVKAFEKIRAVPQ